MSLVLDGVEWLYKSVEIKKLLMHLSLAVSLEFSLS